MKILHLNAGNETGGGMHHILLLLNNLPKEEVILGVFEEGELEKRARSMGIETRVFLKDAQNSKRSIEQVIDFIKEKNVGILHSHGPRANLFGTYIVRKTGCYWISTVHSNPNDDFLGKGIKGKVFTFLNKWSLKRTNHIFAISERFKEMIVSYGIDQNKISIILNGIDFSEQPKKQYAREDFQLSTEDFVIVMVARLEKVKKHLDALRAVRNTIKTNKNIKLVLIGEGSEREEILKNIQLLHIQEHVTFLGHREDVQEILGIADVILLTSKSESFPLVLLEASAQKIPAITTNVGGVNKMIPSAEYGWIVGVGSILGITEAISEAVRFKEDHKLKQIGQLFSEHCKQNFSIEKQVDEIYKTYLSIYPEINGKTD